MWRVVTVLLAYLVIIPLSLEDPLVENAVAVLVMMSMLSLVYFAVLFIGGGKPVSGNEHSLEQDNM